MNPFMRYVRFFILFAFSLVSQENESPEQIQRELNQAQAKYDRAKKMFNPWYTGPLITPSSSMNAPGHGNIQPYLFFGGAYGKFNKDRHSVSLPHNIYSLQTNLGFATGITSSVDIMITPAAIVNWQNNHSGGGFNDLTVTLGFKIAGQTLYVPAMKFTIAETFPTGKYRNLSFNGLGLNSTGGGSYQTQFGFAISKLIWWLYEHPLNLRSFIGYTIETTVHVDNFNAYGGGLHTDGTVRPGNSLAADLGIEWSFTERWVAALDIVYVAQNKTKFHGHTIAPVGGGYQDNLSLAPAIEYNWNENLGILWGVQFSVYGRNSLDFAKGQFSVTYSF
jgi:hypothetical protein